MPGMEWPEWERVEGLKLFPSLMEGPPALDEKQLKRRAVSREPVLEIRFDIAVIAVAFLSPLADALLSTYNSVSSPTTEGCSRLKAWGSLVASVLAGRKQLHIDCSLRCTRQRVGGHEPGEDGFMKIAGALSRSLLGSLLSPRLSTAPVVVGKGGEAAVAARGRTETREAHRLAVQTPHSGLGSHWWLNF
ncbi:hypothetical protein BJ875DRAFT_441247 [Amylocarpus encephaloides]|uniref:Uncharacterized protein n=1 Tax=Amylocarpus encephaloides TaxID=45428 RepID=A0A9P7YJS1_9HELO|nr:hypothetical protein BJ875DRAFT_441247 [Amylocarpus encephaloides]